MTELEEAVQMACFEQLNQRLKESFPILQPENICDHYRESDTLMCYSVWLDEIEHRIELEGGDGDGVHIVYFQNEDSIHGRNIHYHDEKGFLIADPNWLNKAVEFTKTIISKIHDHHEQALIDTTERLESLRKTAALLRKHNA